MRHEFARRMEREAEDLAREFGKKIDGVKPWYSYAALFDGTTTRVFVGLNPGGSGESEELDKEYRKWAYEKPGYCAWLDEGWEKRGGGSYPAGTEPHQKSAHKAFQAMYGDVWQDILRSTPCLNVVPFRTPSREKLPCGAWGVAQPWFRQVLRHLQPDLIICNGNGESKEASAWAALKEFNTITAQKPIHTTDKGRIKYGHVTSGPLKGVAVVALPHLSKPYFWPGENPFQKLRRLRDSRPGLFV